MDLAGTAEAGSRDAVGLCAPAPAWGNADPLWEAAEALGLCVTLAAGRASSALAGCPAARGAHTGTQQLHGALGAPRGVSCPFKAGIFGNLAALRPWRVLCWVLLEQAGELQGVRGTPPALALREWISSVLIWVPLEQEPSQAL